MDTKLYKSFKYLPSLVYFMTISTSVLMFLCEIYSKIKFVILQAIHFVVCIHVPSRKSILIYFMNMKTFRTAAAGTFSFIALIGYENRAVNIYDDKVFGDNDDIVIKGIMKAQHGAFSTMHENVHKTMQSKVFWRDEKDDGSSSQHQKWQKTFSFSQVYYYFLSFFFTFLLFWRTYSKFYDLLKGKSFFCFVRTISNTNTEKCF